MKEFLVYTPGLIGIALVFLVGYFFIDLEALGVVQKPEPEPLPTPKFVIQDEATTTPELELELEIEKKPEEEPVASTTEPDLPEGAQWHNNGGLARTNCDAIEDKDIKNKCTQEAALEKYIKTIAPSSVVTKGFCKPGTAFDDPQNWNQCTDLSDLKTHTVHSIKDLLTGIITYCRDTLINDCGIIITGGSEFGHKGEEVMPDGTIKCVDENSHCGGKKIDLRLTKGLQSLTSTTFEKIEDRDFDGAQQWRDPATGNIYALEPTHWDILIP